MTIKLAGIVLDETVALAVIGAVFLWLMLDCFGESKKIAAAADDTDQNLDKFIADVVAVDPTAAYKTTHEAARVSAEKEAARAAHINEVQHTCILVLIASV
jgi:hypothetical protein